MSAASQTHAAVRPARSYPLRCWWVAALSSEIGRAPLGRKLLETPVMLFRKLDGTVAALEDRCPHRAAPLSLGKLDGDQVICGYHGFQFDAAGRCTKVPTQSQVPSAARVRSFPVIESAPFVWVYLGDPDRLFEVPAPHRLEWASDPAFATISGRLDIAANYMLLKENVMDLTHFGYVHANTFGITDWTEPPKVAVSGDVVTYRQEFRNAPLPPIYAGAIGVTPGTPFDRDNYGSFVSPALQIAAVDFQHPMADEGARSKFHLRICHATTPVDDRHMIYWWAFGRDHGTAPEMMEKFRQGVQIGFAEDEAMIRAVQENMDLIPFSASHPEVSVRSDSAAVQARRALERWMSRETL